MRTTDYFETHPVFTHAEFAAAHVAGGRSPRTVDNVLAHHLRAGRLTRIRRGLYATVPPGIEPEWAMIDPYLVATKLTDDAVVAYHAALQFHGRVYSIWRRFHYLTSVRARPLSFRGMEFVPVQVRPAHRSLPDLGGGVIERPYLGGIVRVTSFERTLVDALDAVDICGGWEEVWRSLELVEFFNLNAVIDHVRKTGSALTAARVGWYLEQHRDELMVEDEHLDALRQHAPSQPRYFHPRRKRGGRFFPGWNLVVPEEVIDRSWDEFFQFSGYEDFP